MRPTLLRSASVMLFVEQHGDAIEGHRCLLFCVPASLGEDSEALPSEMAQRAYHAAWRRRLRFLPRGIHDGGSRAAQQQGALVRGALPRLLPPQPLGGSGRTTATPRRLRTSPRGRRCHAEQRGAGMNGGRVLRRIVSGEVAQAVWSLGKGWHGQAVKWVP